jgi:hypothetical protein
MASGTLEKFLTGPGFESCEFERLTIVRSELTISGHLMGYLI